MTKISTYSISATRESNGEYVGHYDLMASNRNPFIYRVGEFKDIHHWMKLSPQCIGAEGNTLVSWSRTAFGI